MPIKTFFITAANIQKIIEKQKHAPKSFAKDTVLNGKTVSFGLWGILIGEGKDYLLEGKTVSLGHFLVRKIKIIFAKI